MTTTDTPPKAYFIPWDFTSTAHADLMYEQRVTCGWSQDYIDAWRKRSADGNFVMYWLVLSNDLSGRDELLAAHSARYPKQAAPILDTASKVWNQPRTPSNQSFVPIGHIGLGRLSSDDERVTTMQAASPPPGPDDVVAWIGPFYVSWALQRLGLGKLAMAKIESLAAAPPVNGTIVALDAIPPEQAMDPAVLGTFYTKYGNPVPVICNHDWYMKQGYKPYHRKTAYPWTDTETGEVKTLDTVFLQKRL